MNYLEKLDEWGIDKAKLTDKKEQTSKKIQYVTDYVSRWVEISGVRSDVLGITFVDCMCNAGVYRDGDCCTAIEVLNLFYSAAKKYPTKAFRLMCNDIDREKISILRTIISKNRQNLKNVFVEFSNRDVNDYLAYLNTNPNTDGYKVFGYGYSTIVYVDPYDFGTVQIPRLSDLLKNHYCEVMFNFFISDFYRNINQDEGRIRNCLGGQLITEKAQIIQYMRDMLRTGHLKYLFSYSFHIKNNAELYEIIFATPNKRGLELLKESLWKVFNGASYHRNKKDPNQTSLFSSQDSQKTNMDVYEREAQRLLVKQFAGQSVSFSSIEEFLIENTMLRESDIITHVLKPLLFCGKIHKHGIVSSRNFKGDQYTIVCGDGP